MKEKNALRVQNYVFDLFEKDVVIVMNNFGSINSANRLVITNVNNSENINKLIDQLSNLIDRKNFNITYTYNLNKKELVIDVVPNGFQEHFRCGCF